MRPDSWLRYCGLAFLVVGLVVLAFPATSRAQLGMDKDPLGKPGQEPPRQPGDYNPAASSFRAKAEEPYGGQIYCPVTGVKLGLQGEPVPVQTTIGEEKVSAISKMFGKRDKPGAVIYVSGPEHVEQVRANPKPYYSRVVMDHSMFDFNYTQAPDQRPSQPSVHPTASPQNGVQQTSYSGRDATPK